MDLKIEFIIKSLRFIGILIFILIGPLGLFVPAATQASETKTELKIPQALNPGLRHFLDLVDPAKNTNFDPQMAGPVLDFIAGSKDAGALYFANILSGLTPAYYDFDVNRKLNTIVQYAFNPDIPAVDFSRIRGLSDDALKSKMATYSKVLEKRYGSGKPRNKKWPSGLFKNNNRWRRMNREEMESVLVVEYMKYALGKTRFDEVRELLGLKQ